MIVSATKAQDKELVELCATGDKFSCFLISYSSGEK